ncbi:MBL fold metallo-hydrolase RNA specificity domain-containing protein [Acidiluteibacter ferrifornacis]
MNNSIKVHFLGAAETVTGSKYLIETSNHKILVDCGLFQGLKKLRVKNWEHLPVNANEVDVVLLTHGHLDHSGYLPRLVKNGFKRSILGTEPTLDIASIILKDSGKIQEEYAKRANKEGFTSHSPAEALYTIDDAEKAITHFRSVTEGEWINLFDGIQVRFQYNGHIIGATFIELDIHGERLVFSGDIGRPEDLLMEAPKKPKQADYLFIESTYGDRLHEEEDLEEKLKQIVITTVENGGTLIIPSFAVERAQTLMYILWQLRLKNKIPLVEMVMDSPMGVNVLEVFLRNEKWHKLTHEECTEMCSNFRVVETYKETWEVIDKKEPKIIIAGSGMITGGRVLTYLEQYIDQPETAVLLAGYQAEGTRGRQLLEGNTEIKINGKYYAVNAKIYNIQSLSAHADQQELLDWMSDIEKAPKETFIVHGEAQVADKFRVKIKDHLGWKCSIPELYSIHELELNSK